MTVLHLLTMLGEMHYEHRDDGNNTLGFVIIGIFLAVIILLAYMLGKRNKPPEPEKLCPKCQAVRRGKFCSVCGTKF